ncbi:MAG: acyl-CoA dehydrogenase family protein [Thermoleophilia bacterium]|nr:acyl-CoA dehydrogenase family protein [Thermoleophilia bacterium]
MTDSLLTERELAFRDEVRAFLLTALDDQVGSELAVDSVHSPTFYRALAEGGWLGLQWPREYGGLGHGPVSGAILFEEAGFCLAPILAYSVTSMVGSALISVDRCQAKAFLPGIARGEVIFCLGYSEPNVGSDLASLETRAVRQGDDWIVNGSKMFISAAHVANHMFLAARTGPPEERHRTVSVFALDLSSPGVRVEPVYTMEGPRVNVVYLDDVRVPNDAIILGENQGWTVLESALAHERVGMVALLLGDIRRLLGGLIARLDRERGACDRLALATIGQLTVENEAARTMVYSLAREAEEGEASSVGAAMTKLYVSELFERVSQACIRFGGLEVLSTDRDIYTADVQNAHCRSARYTITAGTSEIQRNIIALRGLGLPRR